MEPKRYGGALIALALLCLTATEAAGDNLRASCADNDGPPDQRIRACTSLLNLGLTARNDYATVYYNRGNAHFDKGAYDQAIRDYSEVIRLNPDLGEPYLNRGNAYALSGDDERAIEDLDEAIRLKPYYADAYNSRGVVRRRTCRYDLAVSDFYQAIELAPKDASPYANLAWLLATARSARHRDGRRAVALAEKALELEPGKAKHHGILAAAYAEAGRFADAVSAQDRAIALLKLEGAGPDEIRGHERRLERYLADRPYRE